MNSDVTKPLKQIQVKPISNPPYSDDDEALVTYANIYCLSEYEMDPNC